MPANAPSRRFQPILIIAVLTLWLSLPWVIGWVRTPEDHLFTGQVAGGAEYPTYLSKMHQGYEGFWTWQNRLDPHDHDRRAIYLPFLAVGQLVRMLGFGPEALPVAFHLVATVMMAVAFWVIWRFCRRVLTRDSARLYGLILAVGLSSIGTLLGGRSRLWEHLPSTHIYYAAMEFPHYMINIVGLCLSMVWLLDHLQEPRWWRPLAAATAMFAVAMVHPHVAGMGLMVMGVYVLTVPGAFWRSLAYLIPAGLGALPYTAYMAYLWLTDPMFAQWRIQTDGGGVPLWVLLIGYGLGSLLTWMEARLAWADRGARLAVCWVAVASVLSVSGFLPGSQEFMLGVGVPTGVLVARLIARLGAPLRTVLLVLCQIGMFLVVSACIRLVMRPVEAMVGEYYLPTAQVAAMVQVKEMAGDTPVLAPPHISRHLYALTGGRSTWVHAAETPNADSSRLRYQQLYNGELSLDEALQLLDESGIRMAVSTPPASGESRGWVTGLDRYPFWVPIGQIEGLQLYVRTAP